MFIPLPDLDDRRWTDLVDEARALIPVYGPEWTNHNPPDPGITLVELFAFIAETLIYRANRVPEKLKRQFLALAGVRPLGPAAARATLAITAAEGAVVPLPAGVELSSGGLRFRTTHAVTVTGAAIRSLRSNLGSDSKDLTPAWRRGEPILAFGPAPAAGVAFVITLAGKLRAGDWLSIHLQFEGDRAGLEERSRIAAEAAEAACECAVPRGSCAPARSVRSRLIELVRHHSAQTRWEYLNGSDRWRPLEASDHTRSMTLSGALRVRIPEDLAAVPAAGGDKLARIRCRLVSGEFDGPPRILTLTLDAVEIEQAESVFESWSIARDAVIEGEEPSQGARVSFLPEFRADGQIGKLTFGASGAPALRVIEYRPPGDRGGALVVEARIVGVGTDDPFQEFKLEPNTPLPGRSRVYSLEGGGWRKWERRDNLYASRASDAHFILAGSVLSVGDGWHGRTVAPGSRLIAAWFHTSAESGNLAAGAEFKIEDSPINTALIGDTADEISAIRSMRTVTEAAGGSSAESVEHAIGRAIESREAIGRAVALEDFERLALATPGTRIARAAAKANVHPRLTCMKAPGVVTVVVVPDAQSAKPQPGAGLLRAVARYIGRRRLIGTRVEVVGPEYRTVTVRASVSAQARVALAPVRERIVAALNTYLDPLHGGDAGTGWPLGRDVYRSEILQVIDQVPGVDHVISLELIPDGCEPQCGNVCLRPAMLTTPGKHEIEVTA